MANLYIEYEYWFAAFQLVFAMLGMGATLTTSDFKDVLREPRAVTIGTLMQLLLVPIIALLFIKVVGLTAIGISAGVAIGLALIAAIPGGTISNIFTFMARGNTPLSISITGLTTLICLISTPLILSFLVAQHLPDHFSMPTQKVVTDIGLTLLLPLAIGMLILHNTAKHARWISKWSIRASLFGIVLIVAGSASAGRLDIAAFGGLNVLLVAAFILTMTFLGWLTPRLLGLSSPDRTAIEMEVIVRNVNLAILIKASMFPAAIASNNAIGDMVMFTVLLYGGLQVILAVLVVSLRRRTTGQPAAA